VLETALEAEMSERLGYGKHDLAGRDGRNSRNATRTKTVLTEIGPVQIEVRRDWDGSFVPRTVRRRPRRLDGIDQIVSCGHVVVTGSARTCASVYTAPTGTLPRRSSTSSPSGEQQLPGGVLVRLDISRSKPAK
jgi:hypothetical protein